MRIERGPGRNAYLALALHERVGEFQALVESNQVLRANILREANRLEREFANQRTLSPADLKLVSEGAAKYLRLRDELMRLVDRYQALLEVPEEDLRQRGIDPRTRLVAVMVSAGAALTLYDNYLTTVTRFESSPVLRRFINDGDSATGLDRRAIEEISRSARSLVNRGELRRALQDIEHWKNHYAGWRAEFGDPGGEADRIDCDRAYLESLIETSVAYRWISRVQPGGMTFAKIDSVVGRRVPDLLHNGGDAFMRFLSEIFVEALAVAEPRKGRLYEPESRRKAILGELQSVLRAGDILVEKSGFKLNDRVVPGHFGHTGLWLGTESELEALGVWEDARIRRMKPEALARLRRMTRDGQAVEEALRHGVVLNTVEHFLNVDELVVLRPRMNDETGRREETREALVSALTHLGKAYDFGFDVHARRRLVCSALVFHSYTQPEFRWPKVRTLGRYSISPDHMVLRALPENGGRAPLRPVAMYLDGERVRGDEAAMVSELRRLLRRPALAP